MKDKKVNVTLDQCGYEMGRSFRLADAKNIIGDAASLDISAHRVDKIELTAITTLSSCYVRELRIHLDNGKILEINIFSNGKNKGSLTVHRKPSYDCK